MGLYKLKNLPIPTEVGDAVNKGYRDNNNNNKTQIIGKSYITLSSIESKETNPTNDWPTFNMYTNSNITIKNLSLTIDQDKAVPNNFSYTLKIILFYSDGNSQMVTVVTFTPTNCNIIDTYCGEINPNVMLLKTVFFFKQPFSIKLPNKKSVIGFTFNLTDNRLYIVPNECVLNWTIEY